MAARTDIDTMNASHLQHKLTKQSIRLKDCATPIRINIRRSETTLSPNDENECRQMYEKLQRLQPNGVCVDINTLRRALYPPVSLKKDTNEPLLTFKTYRKRADEIPRLPTYVQTKKAKLNKIERISLDGIVNQ
ncbi:unnamed protein product, partial [Rotaria socialis]